MKKLMEQKRKAVFLDIDGTLVPLGGDEVNAEDIAQIEQAHHEGHLFFLSTARSLANIPAVFTQASWLDGIVAAAGTHILLKNTAGEFTTIYRKQIPEKQLSAICELYIRIGKWCLFEGESALYALGHIMGIIPQQKPFAVNTPNDFHTVYRNAVINKVTIEGDITEAEQDTFGNILYFNNQGSFHEGIIKGESKSKGMQLALNMVGINRKECIAIGDSINDLDMIRFVGTGIAMGNACNELKTVAGYITGDVRHNGVAQALRKYL
jgi:Cof subfamily protein (haloacid dehalogenase superfamily)